MKKWPAGARVYPGLLLILVVPVVLPLFKPGLWASHDPFHHLFRAFDLDYTLRGREIYPRWLPNLGFFYGYPVTNFYSPLGYYFMVFLHWLGLGFISSLKATFGLSFILAAFAAYLWARDVFGEEAGLWAAVVYTYFTYHIANAYVRAALAEHLAFVFFPLILWLVGRISGGKDKGPALLLALGVAGLIFTHNLSAFMFAPFALIYATAAILSNPPGRGKAFLLLLAGAGLGIALTAFYWLPALAETRWIRAGQVAPTVTEPLRFLLPLSKLVLCSPIHKYPVSQHHLSSWQVLIVVCGLSSVALQWRSLDLGKKSLVLAAALSVVIATFMNTTLSSFIWLHFKPLTFLQFPWRFQAMVGLFGSFLAAPLVCFLGRRLPEPVRLLILIFVSAGLAFNALAGIKWEPLVWPETGKPVRLEEEVNLHSMAQYDYQTALWARLWGGPWLLEYLPVTVKVPREEFWLPAEVQYPWPDTYHPPEEMRLDLLCPLKFRLTVKSSEDTYIRWHQFWFPGWQASTGRVRLPVTPSPQLGLVTVQVPAGEHTITIWFGDTFPRGVGKVLSLVSALSLLIAFWRWKSWRGVLWLTLPVILWFGLWGWHNFRYSTCDRPEAVGAIFEDKVALVGVSFRSGGEKAEATLYWMALGPLNENLTAFVHLLGPDGSKLSQHDGPPGESFSPTTRWEPGEIVPDRHLIPIPAGAEPASLRVGLYRLEPALENLTAYGKDGAILGESVHLGVKR